MILYHPTFLIVVFNVLILVLLAFVGYITQNPLVLLGLLLLQQVPLTDPSALMAAEQYDEEEDEVTHDAEDHRIGYLAKVDEKKAA